MEKLLNIITNRKYNKFKKTIITSLLVYVVLFIVMAILVSCTNLDYDVVIPTFLVVNSFLVTGLIVGFFYYYMKFMPLKQSIYLATLDGSLEYISEITGKHYDTDGRIAFSDHFFFDLKTNFFVSYGSIAWIYNKDGAIVLRTTNGKAFRTIIDDENMKALTDANPYILNGYNSNNYKDYTALAAKFKSNMPLNAETIIFDIPNKIKNFWKWLSSKIPSNVFYAIGYTFEALFFIGLIIIANIDEPGARIPNWVFFIWCPLIFAGLSLLYIGQKVESYEPKKYSAPRKIKTKTNKKTKFKHSTPITTSVPPNLQNATTFINKTYIHHLFNLKNTSQTFVALDKRSGLAMKVIDHLGDENASSRYEVAYISYDDVRKLAKDNNASSDYENLHSSTWQQYIHDDTSNSFNMKECKFCGKEFPEQDIDSTGYCPHCADNWWKE